MSVLKVLNISKSFSSIKVLDNINFELKQGEFFSIVGPSGCGKTTLLRIIAGLESPDNGSLFINNTDSTELPPQKRNMGIVFQNYALFPNMTVFENVAYGLQIRKFSRNIIEKKVKEVLEKVSMTDKSGNNVTTLSGGEQQRVSLARVIVTQPALLLFDEPLSNLDYALRLETRNEIKRLQREIGITSIYVTHDQSEALALSDRIAVMNKGSIRQLGSPQQIYFEPENIFVADFIGHSNFFDKRESAEIFKINIGEDEILSVFPEEIIPEKKVAEGSAVVSDVEFTGFQTGYIIEILRKTIKSLVPADARNEIKINAGDKVNLKLLNHRVIKR